METTQIEQEEFRPFEFSDAKELVRYASPVDYSVLLKNIDVLFLGEQHNDYSIASHIESRVKEFAKNEVKTFALELDPSVQPLLDIISNGDLSKMDQIDFSMGWGAKEVEENKKRLIKAIVKRGIRLVAIAEWGNETRGPYTAESEKKAADILAERAKVGKVVVLIGSVHCEYAERNPRYLFKHSIDWLKEQDVAVKSVMFIGGMSDPLEYDRSEEGRLNRVAGELGKSNETFYIDSSRKLFPQVMKVDGLIHLPVVHFKPAQTVLTP